MDADFDTVSVTSEISKPDVHETRHMANEKVGSADRYVHLTRFYYASTFLFPMLTIPGCSVLFVRLHTPMNLKVSLCVV